jgi:hypothetical protein
MCHHAPRHLRAPQDEGAALIDPPPVDHNRTIAANRQAYHHHYDLQGCSLLGHATFAREELYCLARGYTAEYRSVPPFLENVSDRPFILAGHQPELFHPGVWFKNFLLSQISNRAHGIPINLIIDNDVFKRTSIAVPTHGASETVEFDQAGVERPIEDRPIIDPMRFVSFAKRVRKQWEGSHSGADRQILADFWKHVNGAASPLRPQVLQSLLGRRLAQGRHLLEEQLGLQTFELPLSTICQTDRFRWFAAHLMANSPRFIESYNSSLAEFRTANRVRSRSHPVPALEQGADWMEAPFWLWTKENPVRRRLFVRCQTNLLELTDRTDVHIELHANSQSRLDAAIDQLAAAEARGIKLRPRALITTMYARLVLSDLFIHGIGGAKYDELTDLIIRRFFGIEPPAFVTATATFRLPIDRPNISLDDVRASVQRIRDLRYRPESFLRDSLVRNDAHLAPKLAALAAEKRDFLDQHDLRRCSQQVFDQLDSLNRAMHDLLKPVEETLRAQHADLLAQAKQAQLLSSREFSFVLFPSENLPARLLALSRASS